MNHFQAPATSHPAWRFPHLAHLRTCLLRAKVYVTYYAEAAFAPDKRTVRRFSTPVHPRNLGRLTWQAASKSALEAYTSRGPELFSIECIRLYSSPMMGGSGNRRSERYCPPGRGELSSLVWRAVSIGSFEESRCVSQRTRCPDVGCAPGGSALSRCNRRTTLWSSNYQGFRTNAGSAARAEPRQLIKNGLGRMAANRYNHHPR